MAVDPLKLDLKLFRNADYVEEFYFTVDGQEYDFANSVATLELRRYGAEPGAALVVAASVTTFVPGVNSSLGDGSIRLWIAQADIDALPKSPIRGQLAEFAYDLKVENVALGVKEVWLYGTAYVNPGVTVS